MAPARFSTIHPRSWNVPRWLAAALLLLLSLGCGSIKGPSGQPEVGFEAAQKAMESNDYEAASEAWTSVLEGGGLGPDQYGEALILRAVCRAHLGQFAEAREDLDVAAQGVPDMDRVYAAEAFVLTKEGKKAEADAKMKEARRLNPRVKPFNP